MLTQYEKEKLIKLRKKGYSWRKIAKEFENNSHCKSYSHEYLRRAYSELVEQTDDARILSVLAQHKVISLYDLADEVDMSPRRVQEMLENLIAAGKNITIKDKTVIFNEPKKGTEIKLDNANKDYIKFGIVSDTHLGSRYQQLTALYDFYERCKDEKVDVIFHAGDWVAGKGVYKGQEYDSFLHSMKEQREYLTEKYPEVGIRTIGITGNHDESWTAIAGEQLIFLVTKQREDIQVVAEYQAFIDFSGIKICLYHPDSGQAYAISYKLQKLVESFTAENLPDVVIMGHFHQKEYVTIRNVECFQAACFEAQTPYEVRKNLHPVIGGWIVEVARIGDKVEIAPKFVKYKPKKDDWL